MTITENDTLARIVSDDYRAALVFNKYNLDFCCNGKRTLNEACRKAGLNSDAIMQEIGNRSGIQQDLMHLNYWSADFLADYIVANHHAYVRDMIPLILKHSEKASSKHGSRHPELKEIHAIFSEIADELSAHMMKEERMLFPYIKQLVVSGSNCPVPPFGNVSNPVKVMEDEHKFAGDAMARIRELTNDYNTPEDLCETCRVLYKELNEFEQDLHMHVHLENNILFPMAKKLERPDTASESSNSCPL